MYKNINFSFRNKCNKCLLSKDESEKKFVEVGEALLKLADVSIIGRYDSSLPHPYFGKKFVLTSNRIDINYFKPNQIVEFVVGKRIITKTGIFKQY